MGRIVLYAIERNKALEDLSVEEFKQFAEVIGEDVYPHLQLENILSARSIIGGVALSETQKEIASLGEMLRHRED